VAFSNRPWSQIKESDYRDAAAFCSACLIDLNPPGGDKSKGDCKLPVKEPGGAVNINAVHAAAAALAGARGGVQAPTDKKRAAAKRLVNYYGQDKNGPPAPDSLKRMANG
jgi:hypothetical protein